MGIRVVIADDEPVVLAGLVSILTSEDDIDVVGQGVNGQQAVEQVIATRPDVALLDVRMPVMSGIEAAETISRTRDDEAPTYILMLTTFTSEDALYAALRVGATGFLMKDAGADTLIAAVRAVTAGQGWLTPSLTRLLIAQFAARRGAIEPSAVKAVNTLTARELDVLTLLAGGRSNAEIADELFLGEATVKSHVSHLLSKVGLRDRSQAVALAFMAGVATPHL